MKLDMSAGGRGTVLPDEGPVWRLEADMVIEALGFSPEDAAAMAGGARIELTRRGTVKADPKTFETGEPALLSADTTKDWLGWQGAAALGFFAPNQQGMGLNALAKEYKGKLPIGGVRPTDTAVQQAFGVKPTDLPVILVLQRGTVSMRLGGNSNHATLKTLINSALSSAGPPPPPCRTSSSRGGARFSGSCWTRKTRSPCCSCGRSASCSRRPCPIRRRSTRRFRTRRSPPSRRCLRA